MSIWTFVLLLKVLSAIFLFWGLGFEANYNQRFLIGSAGFQLVAQCLMNLGQAILMRIKRLQVIVVEDD